MPEVTLDDRKKELRSLLDQIRAHPERDWTVARDRIAILNHMVAGQQQAKTA